MKIKYILVTNAMCPDENKIYQELVAQYQIS